LAATPPQWQHAKPNQTGESKKQKKKNYCGTAQDFGQAWRKTRMNVKFLSDFHLPLFRLINQNYYIINSKYAGATIG
jgi:Neuraminidase (sialidase)